MGKLTNIIKFKISTVLTFFALVTVFSIPFWVLGEWKKIQLLPGLPIDAFMIVCPVLAAIILIYKENGKKEMIQFLKRGIDFKNVKPKSWYAVTLFLMPVVSVLVFLWLRLSGIMVPKPDAKASQVIVYIIMFFVAALCEELGWTGYLTDPLQSRLGAMNAGIIIGVCSVIYHLVALVHVHRSLEWIIWWSVGTVALRVIIVWLYNNTGRSVFIATLFHMTINLTWQLFPIDGSYYSPSKTGIILILITVCIIMYYGPHRLIRKRKF